MTLDEAVDGINKLKNSPVVHYSVPVLNGDQPVEQLGTTYEDWIIVCQLKNKEQLPISDVNYWINYFKDPKMTFMDITEEAQLIVQDYPNTKGITFRNDEFLGWEMFIITETGGTIRARHYAKYKKFIDQ